MEVDDILQERGDRYGAFPEHARITQNIKRAMIDSPNWPDLEDSHKEALEMVAHKIGRILNGDPYYQDSWTDIIGYARLVEKDLAQFDSDLSEVSISDHHAEQISDNDPYLKRRYRRGQQIGICFSPDEHYEIPAPELLPLKLSAPYFIPRPDSQFMFSQSIWENSDIDFHRLESGLIHLNQASAIEHAKTILEMTK